MGIHHTEPLLSIASVERDTGLSKDTLRVWERRYGFPRPERDEHGDRAYPPEQVEKLRLIRRLLDQGGRPAKLAGASTAELLRQIEGLQAKATDTHGVAAHQDEFLKLTREHRSSELRAALQQVLLKQGLQRFASETLAALNVAVGNSWLCGELDITAEHLYSEQVQNVLRNAIGSQPATGGSPRILLTTLPEELHGLGILLAEAMLVPEGATCVSLGTQTPLADIRIAASANDFDVVALSFSAAFPARQAVDGLKQLREQLPEEIALWAGGSALSGKQAKLKGVRVITSLDDALAALAEWRSAQRS